MLKEMSDASHRAAGGTCSPIDSIISLLKIIFEVAVPMWLQPQNGGERGLKFFLGVQRTLHALRTISIRQTAGAREGTSSERRSSIIYLPDMMMSIMRPTTAKEGEYSKSKKKGNGSGDDGSLDSEKLSAAASSNSSSGVSSISSSSGHRSCLYQLLPRELRIVVLDIWHFCSFEYIGLSLLETLETVFTHMTSYHEPSYLLGLTFLRRDEFKDDDQGDEYMSIMRWILKLAVVRMSQIVREDDDAAKSNGGDRGGVALNASSSNLSSHLEFITQIIDLVQNYINSKQHDPASVDASTQTPPLLLTEFCHVVIRDIAGQLLLPHFKKKTTQMHAQDAAQIMRFSRISYRQAQVTLGDQTSSSWMENYTLVASVHAILFKLCPSFFDDEAKSQMEGEEGGHSDALISPVDDPPSTSSASTSSSLYRCSLEFYVQLFVSLFASDKFPVHLFRSADTHNLGVTSLVITNQVASIWRSIGALLTLPLSSRLDHDNSGDVDDVDNMVLDSSAHVIPCREDSESFFVIDILYETIKTFIEELDQDHDQSSQRIRDRANRLGIVSCVKLVSDPELLRTMPKHKIRKMMGLEECITGSV